jgi:predicted enzyme related to lactoylglutathione lyase
MNRVEHFDVYADDPHRAIKFYIDVFGWMVKKWEGPMDYWLVTTGPGDQPGIDGGIAKREDPNDHTTNTIGVPNVDEYSKKILAAGGRIIAPKMAIPGVGWFALCQDTEGNKFGLMEEDPQAK